MRKLLFDNREIISICSQLIYLLWRGIEFNSSSLRVFQSLFSSNNFNWMYERLLFQQNSSFAVFIFVAAWWQIDCLFFLANCVWARVFIFIDNFFVFLSLSFSLWIGKTRTKDKYRVVYTDYQRLELEKEYHMAQYITIRRKSELAQALQLSERQVKIWFQNRRAKQRKLSKKRDDPTTPMSNGSPTVGNGLMNGSLSLQHQHMAAGIDFKPKLEPGLGHHHHHPSQIHNLHHHSMHQLSSMSMGLHNSIAGLHFTHHPSAPPPLSPPTPSSIASSIHHQHTHMS